MHFFDPGCPTGPVAVASGEAYEFMSPHYPNNYPDDVRCTYTLTAPSDHVSSLSTLSFWIVDKGCKTVLLQVFTTICTLFVFLHTQKSGLLSDKICLNLDNLKSWLVSMQMVV